MILVINHNKTAYIEKYKLFYHAEEAIEYADSLGFSKYSFIGLHPEDLKIGMMNMINAGEECNLEVIRLSPESKPKSTSMSDHFGWGGC